MATLIKNGLLYDGTGNAPQRVDVLLEGGVIRDIGNISISSRYEVVDALECLIFPGFIETSLRFDDACAVFSPAHEATLLACGITSVVGGSFGESLVPFSSRLLIDGAHRRCILHTNRNWDSTRGFFKTLERKNSLAVNFGTLVGLDTLKHYVLRESISRDFSSEELKKVISLLKKNISEGALGLSVDLSDSSGMLFSKQTLETLAVATKESDGVFATTLRGIVGFEKAFEELVSLARKTGVNFSISNFPEPYTPDTSALEDAFRKAEEFSARAHLHFDFSPWGEREGNLRDFLPPWFHTETETTIRSALSNSLSKKRIVEYLRETLPKSFILSGMPHSFAFLNGKEFNAFAKSSKRRIPEMFISLLSSTNIKGEYHIAYKWDTQLLLRMMRSPASCVASGMSLFSNAVGIHTPINVARDTEIPLESVVSAYTLAPAKKYGLFHRGIIKIGYVADVSVFSEKGVLKELFINGARAVREGILVPSVRVGRGMRKKI